MLIVYYIDYSAMSNFVFLFVFCLPVTIRYPSVRAEANEDIQEQAQDLHAQHRRARQAGYRFRHRVLHQPELRTVPGRTVHRQHHQVRAEWLVVELERPRVPFPLRTGVSVVPLTCFFCVFFVLRRTGIEGNTMIKASTVFFFYNCTSLPSFRRLTHVADLCCYRCSSLLLFFPVSFRTVGLWLR